MTCEQWNLQLSKARIRLISWPWKSSTAATRTD